MSIVYLTEQQSWVGREGDCLIVHIPLRDESGKPLGKRERKKPIPLFKVEEVIVMGDVTITTPALASLLQAKVQITYLSRRGDYLGTLSPVLTRNSLLRIAQHKAYANGAKRHDIARRFVIGKLRNMRTMLMRYQRQYPDPVIGEQVDCLKRCILAAQQTTYHEGGIPGSEIDVETEARSESDRMHGLGSLIGCEGAGSAAYFSVFDRLIKCDWQHGFTKRSRRPPTDPVNALLSYGYVVLASQVASMLALVGFDPYVGYLHASRYGKPALALDLMEEFRPLIVDSVVLSLLNNRQLEAKDFEFELNSYRMTDATKRLFLEKFEERMQEAIIHPVFGNKATYRHCIETQGRLLAKYLTGEIEQYTPFTVR